MEHYIHRKEPEEIKILYSGYNKKDNIICITTGEEDLSINGEDVAEDILWVYDRKNVVYVLHWKEGKLEKKELSIEQIINKI